MNTLLTSPDCLSDSILSMQIKNQYICLLRLLVVKKRRLVIYPTIRPRLILSCSVFQIFFFQYEKCRLMTLQILQAMFCLLPVGLRNLTWVKKLSHLSLSIGSDLYKRSVIAFWRGKLFQINVFFVIFKGCLF